MRFSFLSVTLAACLAVSSSAECQKLRELSTDRPDRTESPYTVDARHIQVEMDALNMTDAVRNGVGPRAFGFGAVNTKIGISSRVDIQFVTQLLTISTDREPGITMPRTVSGVSDLTTRLKINLWGDDEGRTAFAIMPYLTAPVSADAEARSLTGGIILPLAIGLGRGWDMGVMSELDVVRGIDGRGYNLNTLHSITTSHDIAGPIGGYMELVAETIKTDRVRLVPTGDAGITIGVGENAQVDFGANLGLNRNADRVTAFVGISKRY